MDGKYWFRIALGMLLVFAVGMLIAQGIHKGMLKGREIFEGSGPVNLPLLGMGFRFEGQKIGGIQHLKLLRSAPKRIDSAVVDVKLDQALPPPSFDGCRLMLDDLENINSHSSFRCATPDDSSRLALVPFGHLVLEPGQEQVVLWIPGKAAGDLRGRGLAQGDTGGVDVQSHAGGLSIKVNGKELVSLGGDSTGGFLRVRDGQGRPIVEAWGDSSGGSLMVRDTTGRTRVNIDATTGTTAKGHVGN